MNQDEVLEAILSSEELPTLPIVASKLITLTSQEETTLTDIANLVSKDMALSTKILKVSNSAFYSFPQQIGSINQAVSILGTNAVRSLVLSFSFLSMKGDNEKSNFNFETFWECSLAGAVAAKLIMEQIPEADTEEIFISGLLQNVGQLIFASTLPGLYNDVLSKVNDAGTDELQLEEEIIGASHPLTGFTVAKHWGFPEGLLQPIKYHHNPEGYENGNQQVSRNIRAVYLADLMVKILFSETPEVYHKQFRSEAKRMLGLKVLAINKILKQVHSQVDQTADYFGLKIQPTKSVEEILQEANLKLSLLNMSYEEVNRELIKSKMELEKLTRELEHKNKLLENLANIDGLTEVNNHRYFQNFLDLEINRSIRNGRTISILLADIDHFKKFNDTYGHQTGDFILKEFCRVTKEQIREYDLIARYGGEEFVFVLPETEPEDARTVAEKLCKAVADYAFDDGESVYHVTISIGVASARPSGRDFKKNEFVGLADEALYQAKGNGRNQVAMFNPKKKKKWFNF
ncbi:MAG: HDOD domain-containing protein [Desulfobulbaceae bacterium]|nr:HDOD domain-containing protein [Desulfobulbaceae bacterium]